MAQANHTVLVLSNSTYVINIGDIAIAECNTSEANSCPELLLNSVVWLH